VEYALEMSRWNREISNSLLDGGSPTTAGRKITHDSIKPLEGKVVTCYCIIEACNLEEAVEISQSAPPLYEGGSAEVYKLLAV